MSLRVLVVDDHHIMRQGLCQLLRGQAPEAEVFEAEDGRAAVRLAAELAPDVVVMDLSMPELNGIDATRQILADRPAIRVVALSAHTDRRRVTEALKAGASAYLPKDAAFEELAAAIHEVRAGRMYLNSKVAATLVEGQPDRPTAGTAAGGTGSVFERLTPREREVLQLIAEGKATKEVAGRLRVSIKTVETHRRSIMDKLDLDSVAQLTKYALREGLTSLET